MRWVLLALLVVAASGCTAPPPQAVERGNPTLIADFADNGTLAVEYKITVKEYQAGAALENQHGTQVWSSSGQIQPGQTASVHHALAGDRAYWVELSVDRVLLSGGNGLSFHLDPARCDKITQATYVAENSLDSWGGTGKVVMCGEQVVF